MQLLPAVVWLAGLRAVAGAGSLVIGTPTPESCAYDGDCLAIERCAESICVLKPTPRAGEAGSPCTLREDCGSPLFCNTEEGGVCCNLWQCPDITSCRVPGHEGLCTLPHGGLPLPAGLGESCTRRKDCASQNCVQGVCCETPACDPGESCDITGFRGSCVTPLPFGEFCYKDSDCEPGLVCRGDSPFCRPSPSDCDANGTVEVDDVVRLVSIALEATPIQTCTAGDLDSDGRITVVEIVVAVRQALGL